MGDKIINTLEDLGVSDVNEVDWFFISANQKLSESFIEKHSNEVKWILISTFQKLSEDLIEQFADKVSWSDISRFQKLSEPFIDRFANKVDWYCISTYQKLSETFIEKHSDKVNWYRISTYQKLSEDFIEKFSDKIDWCHIARYQKLSNDFINKYSDRLIMPFIYNSWAYKPTKFKKQAVIDTGLYECHDDYFIAYKGIRSDRYSDFNFQYQYLPGVTYETHADYSNNEGSFGFSAWTYKKAKYYCPELVVKVKIYYEDVARVVHNGGKIRCSKMTVLN